MIQVQEKRCCSKCGTVRSGEVERCPDCGTKRSRKLKPRILSFWKLPEADRRHIAGGMYDAITQRRSADEAAATLFIERQLPQFKEYYRYYRMYRWSYQIDGAEQLDFEWYQEKRDHRFNQFTGLRWPPRL